MCLLPCTPRLPGEKIWIRTNEPGVNNLHGTVIREKPDSLPRCGIFIFIFFLSAPLEAEDDVCPGILCRFFQMHTSSLSEDSASCACRVAGPQPRGLSVRQQSDGQHHRPTGRDGLPQVSPLIYFSLFLCLLCTVLPPLLLGYLPQS